MEKFTNYQNLEEKLHNDNDFILLKRFDYSLKKFLERNPNGATNKIIAQALGLTEAEVATQVSTILAKLKASL